MGFALRTNSVIATLIALVGLTTQIDFSSGRHHLVGQRHEFHVTEEPADGRHVQGEGIEKVSRADSVVDVSLTPELTVRNATPEQYRRLLEAIHHFQTAGLLLPDLVVHFSDNIFACGGHHGLFRSELNPWQIKICSELDFVYEHELAHAWERANLTEETRRQFMEMRGYTTWAAKSAPWNERGVEGAAFVLQQGLSGLPLPPYLSREHQSRLEAFELLTSQASPRLLEWCLRQDRQEEQVRGLCQEAPAEPLGWSLHASGRITHGSPAPKGR